MEIVSYIGYNESENYGGFNSVILWFRNLYSRLISKIGNEYSPYDFSGINPTSREKVHVKKEKIIGKKEHFEINFSFERIKLFCAETGRFLNLVIEKKNLIGFAALGILIIIMVCGSVAAIHDYIQTVPVSVELENSYESEQELLGKAMTTFALDESQEYDENGNLAGSVEISEKDMEKLFRQPVTFQTYKVQSGDTISGITKKFGLKNLSTIIAVNDIDNVRTLGAGQKLKIPSVDGLIYTVQKGNSLAGLSSKFGITMEDLLDVNELDSSELHVGQNLFIPGAKLDYAKIQQAMGELFKCPISAKYRLTSRFGPRSDPFTGAKSNHTGVDMACPTGTPITATSSGTVVFTGVSPVFGNYVIIRHGNGYQSLYGHMSLILAKKGQRVSQGTRIGLVGSTGYSTGPHLHFTVFKNGKLVDPMSLIK